MIDKIITIFIIICFLYLFLKITIKTYRYYQQSHYHIKDVSFYIYKYYLKDKANYLIYLIFLCSFFKNTISYIVILLTTLILIIFKEREKVIIKLKITPRIKRLLLVNIAIYFVFLFFKHDFIYINIAFFLQPITSFFSYLLLIPIERIIQKSFIKKAKKKLKQSNAKVIAITGSFGKTTTKHFLFEIIKGEFLSSISPRSYNTINGIAKTINEMPLPREKIILEYGASHKNDIVKLTRFIKPSISIVSSIGHQHLKTFKSLENIIKEKMALIECLNENDIGIINIDDENIKKYKIKSKAKIITVGTTPNSNYQATNITYNENGISFIVRKNNENFNIKTKLLGRHNIINILLAVAASDILGIKKSVIEREVANLKPVSHRLEMIYNDNYLIIDDSFNCNFQGFINALEVLSFFDSKKVLITPGIVEGGIMEREMNREIGKEIIKQNVRVYLVENKASSYIKEVFDEEGFNNYKVVFSTTKAFKMIATEVPRAVILIENDILDYYK